ncbi:hypothetical protein C8R44DRAFT_976096 [Mycena epipterygia]|nr:hypothetical protein C8R44DRAFT_976096 [Mycena epipterygia]
MSPGPLAQELLDSIVDHVQERGTLKACSLAARSFVVSSQRRLFRSLCLFIRVPSQPPRGTNHLTVSMTFQNALHVFTMSSYLGSYVRHLYIGLVHHLQDYGLVESALRIVSKITLLGIFGVGGTYDWSTIPPSLATLLKDIALRPAVRSLYLENIRAVPSSFILCPSFRVLSLYFASVEGDIASTSPFISPSLVPLRSHHLEHLVTAASPGHPGSRAIENMQGRLTGLRKLSLLGLYARPDKPWMPFLLQSDVQRSLRHLELSFIGKIPELGLPPLLALRSLEIGFSINTTRLSGAVNSSIELALESALTNIHTVSPLLESLSLTIQQWNSASWPQGGDPLPSFASLDLLPALQEVHCSLDAGGYPVQAGFEQSMGRKFPGPKEAGMLTCSIA